MAIIRPSTAASGARRRLGGTVLRNSRSIGFAANVPGRSHGASPAQVASRAAFAALVREWQTIGEANRTAWNAWADAFNAGDPDNADRRQSGFNRFVGLNRVRASTDLPQLDAPTNPGVGSAEPAYVDVWPDLDAGTVTIRMLQPMLIIDAEPLRVVVYQGPPQVRTRKRDPRSWRPLAWFDPVAGQPGIDAPPLVLPLQTGGIPRPWFWASAITAAGDGNLSPRTLWPTETVGPGRVLAFRLRPGPFGTSPTTVERTPDGVLNFTYTDGGTEFDFPYPLTDPQFETVGKLAAGIDISQVWLTSDLNSGVADRPSTDIPVFPRESRTMFTQPKLITLAA